MATPETNIINYLYERRAIDGAVHRHYEASYGFESDQVTPTVGSLNVKDTLGVHSLPDVLLSGLDQAVSFQLRGYVAAIIRADGDSRFSTSTNHQAIFDWLNTLLQASAAGTEDEVELINVASHWKLMANGNWVDMIIVDHLLWMKGDPTYNVNVHLIGK